MTEAQAHTKNNAESRLGIVFDKVQPKGGEEASINAMVQVVLNIGVYPPLLETRKLVLEHAGHVVITKTEDAEIASACEEYQFDVGECS